MRVLVTGGTGQLGRETTRVAVAAGHIVRVLSRRTPKTPLTDVEWAVGDLVTGEGLSQALAGIDAIVHAASDSRNSEAVDIEGTKHLLDVSRAVNVAHVVYVSIVGVDKIPFAYYQHKFEAERLIAGGGVPFSILRATQFHPFVASLLDTASRFPFIMPIPSGFLVQSVAIDEVADRVCRALDEGPRGMLRDFGGPEILTVEDAATEWMRYGPRGFGIMPVPVHLPGKTAAALRSGYNTCPNGDRGRVTWKEWLEGDFPARFGPRLDNR